MKTWICMLLLTAGASSACGYIPQNLKDWTTYYASSYGIDPDLAISLIWVESNYCPDRTSPKGAVGLGQLTPGVYNTYRIDPRNPIHNIYGTVRYLREMWDTFGDWNLALAAYNAGPNAVKKHGGIPPYPETINHVKKVLGTYWALKEQQNKTNPKNSMKGP